MNLLFPHPGSAATPITTVFEQDTRMVVVG